MKKGGLRNVTNSLLEELQKDKSGAILRSLRMSWDVPSSNPFENSAKVLPPGETEGQTSEFLKAGPHRQDKPNDVLKRFESPARGERADWKLANLVQVGSAALTTGDVLEESCSSEQVLAQIADRNSSSRDRLTAVCSAEIMRFEGSEKDKLVDVLWEYIQENRNSNNPDELVAVGAAIRKYIANMPMNSMGKLSNLLEPNHRTPLPPSLELEVAKMIYRNFGVFPPSSPDPHPELSNRLWEMAKEYMIPRFILRDNYGTIATMAIAAIIAMRSKHAEEAWSEAMQVSHRWFGMIVRNDVADLYQEWITKNQEAAEWLDQLRSNQLEASAEGMS